MAARNGGWEVKCNLQTAGRMFTAFVGMQTAACLLVFAYLVTVPTVAQQQNIFAPVLTVLNNAKANSAVRPTH